MSLTAKFDLFLILMLTATLKLGVRLSYSAQFLKQPTDLTLQEGKTAFIPCIFEEANVAPSWQIEFNNGTVLKTASSTLPVKHRYNGSGLILSTPDITMSGTTYMCYLIFFDVNVHQGFNILKSTRGRLTVFSNPQHQKQVSHCPEASPCNNKQAHLNPRISSTFKDVQ